MCGIVGIISSRAVLSPTDKKIFNQMLLVDVVRGHHSTGIFGVAANGECSTHKKAMPASDFLDLKSTTDFLFDRYTALIGHNRWATKGAVTTANAHPFTHGDITLIHNGSLLSMNTLPDYKRFSVDSEAICYSINKIGAVETIKLLHGAFALVWHDASSDTINIVRNSERPMCIGKDASGDVYFASEKGMLTWITGRNNVSLSSVEELPVAKIYAFNTLTNEETMADVSLRANVVYTQKSISTYNTNNNRDEFVAGKFVAYTANAKKGVVHGVTVTDGVNIAVHNFDKEDFEENCIYVAMGARYEYAGKVVNKVAHRYSIVYEDDSEEATYEKKPDCAWCGHPIEKTDPMDVFSGDKYHTTCLHQYNADIPHKHIGKT